MRNAPSAQFEVWAQIKVSAKSTAEIHNFFRQEYRIDPQYLISNLHITIYHSRRPMPDLEEIQKSCSLSIDTMDTRFMVLAPGGENPRSYLIPGKRKVGIRIRKGSELRDKINDFRQTILPYENAKILGRRKASSNSRNAFGARNFQPHIALLSAGSGIITDLTEVGNNFRDSVPEIFFDKFFVQKKRNF